MNFKNLLFLLLAVGLFSACSKDDPETVIQEYITENGLTTEVTPEGLHYVIETQGNGKTPTISDEVKVHYKGFLTDGEVFDGNQNTRVADVTPFPLGQVIRGWQIGIPLFKEGGEGLLIIPPDLGYGSNPPGGSGIPKNAVLVFEVKLLDVI